MKKLYKMLLSLVMVGTLFLGNTVVYAAAVNQADQNIRVVSETTEYLENGMTVTTTVYEEQPILARGLAASTTTKSGSKSQTFRNSSGKAVLTFTVYGEFEVNTGVSAECIDASYDYSIKDSAWELDSGSAWESGNKAYASGSFSRSKLGVEIDSLDADLTLTCSSKGKLS